MYDLAIMWDWIAFSVRWLHVITAMAWIGASFYFIALDLGLRKAANMPHGVHGEEWQVHGGGGLTHTAFAGCDGDYMLDRVHCLIIPVAN